MADNQALFDLENVFEVDDYLYFYAEALTNERTDQEVQALVDLLAIQPGMRVLDLACGFGRHANRLAQLGCQVTGVDLMPGFLELARRDAAECGVRAEYRQGDMRALTDEGLYDRVLILFTAFGYFDDAGNLEVLRCAGRALRPGGLLCFDSQNRDAAGINLLPSIVTEKEGNLMIDRNTFDSLTGLWTNRRIVIRDGKRRDRAFTIRFYNPSEIHLLLAQAGLQLERVLGGWDGKPASIESRRMVIIARKS